MERGESENEGQREGEEYIGGDREREEGGTVAGRVEARARVRVERVESYN